VINENTRNRLVVMFAQVTAEVVRILKKTQLVQVIAPGRRDDIPTVYGSSTRGGFTSVRGRVRRPHMAKLQAASVPIA